MTGFGRGSIELEGERITVELSAVNHRFLECSFRLPYAWTSLETSLRDLVKKKVARGKVNISIRRSRGPAGRQQVRCDEEVAQQYIDAVRSLGQLMTSTEALSLNTLARLEGVFYQEEEKEDLDSVRVLLEQALEQAFAQLNQTRINEGAVLATDTETHITLMRECLGQIEERLPELSKAYEDRLRSRIADLRTETELSEDRIAMEVAMLADKTDVHEEVVRLKAHFDHVMELLSSEEPMGRELNFLAQEIQREINTLGSKLRDLEVTREVLRMKSELEKLREQAQNIE
jgi:uncharacterized protein (TIGR00255 family)